MCVTDDIGSAVTLATHIAIRPTHLPLGPTVALDSVLCHGALLNAPSS